MVCPLSAMFLLSRRRDPRDSQRNVAPAEKACTRPSTQPRRRFFCSSCPRLGDDHVIILAAHRDGNAGSPGPGRRYALRGSLGPKSAGCGTPSIGDSCDYLRGGIPTPNRRFRSVLILSAMVGLRECGVHLACQVSRGYRGCRTRTCRTRRLSHPDPYLACVSRQFRRCRKLYRLGLALRARPEFMATASPGTSPRPRKWEG